jgi:hypothetical protein
VTRSRLAGKKTILKCTIPLPAELLGDWGCEGTGQGTKDKLNSPGASRRSNPERDSGPLQCDTLKHTEFFSVAVSYWPGGGETNTVICEINNPHVREYLIVPTTSGPL